MKNADLYIRARCDNRAAQTIFEHQQERALLDYCQFNGINVRMKIIDNCSAGNFQRPGWSSYFQSLASASIRPDLLLFTSWDRWSRNIQQLIEVRSRMCEMGIITMPIDTYNSLEEALKIYSLDKKTYAEANIVSSFSTLF